METALSTISVMPVGKAQTEAFINALINEITGGSTDPLRALVALKYIEKTVTETLKSERVDEAVLTEFLKYGKGEKVVIDGAELKQMEAGVKYDYNATGDVVWMDLDKKISELTERKKAREKLLQNLDEKGMVDPDYGNYITRPPKSSKTKISVTIK